MGTVLLTLLVAAIPALVLVYAYAAYPLILKVMGWPRATGFGQMIPTSGPR